MKLHVFNLPKEEMLDDKLVFVIQSKLIKKTDFLNIAITDLILDYLRFADNRDKFVNWELLSFLSKKHHATLANQKKYLKDLLSACNITDEEAISNPTIIVECINSVVNNFVDELRLHAADLPRIIFDDVELVSNQLITVDISKKLSKLLLSVCYDKSKDEFDSNRFKQIVNEWKSLADACDDNVKSDINDIITMLSERVLTLKDDRPESIKNGVYNLAILLLDRLKFAKFVRFTNLMIETLYKFK